MASTLILTNHLGRHSINKLFFFKFLRKSTQTVSFLLDLNIFEALLENWRSNLGKEVPDVIEVDFLIFLQKPDYVRLALLFDKVRKVARLRIVDLSFGLDLAHCINLI